MIELNPDTSEPSLEIGPTCKDICHVGGKMSYNEFSERLIVAPGTRMRLWIF